MWRSYLGVTPLTVVALVCLTIYSVASIQAMVSVWVGTVRPPANVDNKDFVQLYTGALLIARGDGPGLYDLSAQATTRQVVLDREKIAPPARSVVHLPYVSPPFVVLFFVPLL